MGKRAKVQHTVRYDPMLYARLKGYYKKKKALEGWDFNGMIERALGEWLAKVDIDDGNTRAGDFD